MKRIFIARSFALFSPFGSIYRGKWLKTLFSALLPLSKGSF
jgi:hypothetical protein